MQNTKGDYIKECWDPTKRIKKVFLAYVLLCSEKDDMRVNKWWQDFHFWVIYSFNDNNMNLEIVQNSEYFRLLDPAVHLFGWHSCNVVKLCKVIKNLVTSVNCRQKLMIVWELKRVFLSQFGSREHVLNHLLCLLCASEGVRLIHAILIIWEKAEKPFSHQSAV